jgi:hypothetical protein
MIYYSLKITPVSAEYVEAKELQRNRFSTLASAAVVLNMFIRIA